MRRISGATDLSIRSANESIACDEVGHDSLGPRIRAFAVVERHHQLPQVRFGAHSEVLQDAAL